MNIDNFIEMQYRVLTNDITDAYINFYNSFSNTKLQQIFSTIQYMLEFGYERMNERLPTFDSTNYFWADDSRYLLKAIEVLRTLERILKNTPYEFEIDSYYEDVIKKSEGFLQKSRGSEIPAHMEKICIYYTEPILHKTNTVNIKNGLERDKYVNLKFIGEGSYANVFSFKDSFYNKKFVVKRAKNNLSPKEIERFKREYLEMKSLSSPYIVEVYNYNSQKNEYIMEFMDYTLDKYYEKYNAILSKDIRKNIARQILAAFKYIHSKNILHRDISPKNILVKTYDDDVRVIKVSDFGLVKTPDSMLTTLDTEFKGWFNDPSLNVDGFVNYNIVHETYALTRLIYFVMTGKINMNINNINDSNLKKFVQKGTNSEHKNRYQSVDEIINTLKIL